MNFRIAKRTTLLCAVLGVFYTFPVGATPIGTLNINSCLGGGVTVTATAIDFTNTCIQAGADTNFQTAEGTILPGPFGTIADLMDPFPPGFNFFSFNPGGGDVIFSPTSLGPGSANTVCSISPCSVVAGSPFILFGDVSTTVILPIVGTVTDSMGTSNFVGQFSANFAGKTPLDLQQEFAQFGQLSSTTFAGSFVAVPIPEPGTVGMAVVGMVLLAFGRSGRKRPVNL